MEDPARHLNIISEFDLAALAAEGFEVELGRIGETLAVTGLDVARLVPGDRLRIGPSVVVEVTSARTPCRRLGGAHGMRPAAARGKLGVYARIVMGGEVRRGATVRLETLRVVLVHNPAPDSAEMPLGPLSLMAVGREAGVEVELLSFPTREQEQGFITGLRTAHVIGFSTVASNYPRLVAMVTRLRRECPSAYIVFGGPHATVTAAETIEAVPAVDLVLRGEAEESWGGLMAQARHLRWEPGALVGATWAEGAELQSTPDAKAPQDLDNLPMPAFGSWRPEPDRAVAMVEIGRGCPFECTFCSTNLFFSRRFRLKSASRIVQEILEIHRLHGIERFALVHDMFTVRRPLVIEVCDALAKLPWAWSCSSRTDRLDEAMLERLADSGCDGLYFGIETGSRRLQEVLKKRLDVEASSRVIRQTRRLGIGVTASFIVGFPHETRQDLRETLLFATDLMSRKSDPDRLGPDLWVQVHLFGPLAQTPIARQGCRFAFDGCLSNVVEEFDTRPNLEETGLIASCFPLFSAFYHPADTELSREDYVALAWTLEDLPTYPLARRFILERDRIGFVEFLVRGGYGRLVYDRPRAAMLPAVLRAYAAQGRGAPVLGLMALADARSVLETSAVGQSRSCSLMGAAMDLVRGPSGPRDAVHSNDLLHAELVRVPEGVRLQLDCRGRAVR